jgi:iron complex outermembrane receptor protein
MFSWFGPLGEISYKSEVMQLDLAHTYSKGENWRLESHFTYNHETFDWYNFENVVIPLRTNDKMVETTLFYNPNDKLELLFGGVAERLRSRNLGGISDQFNSLLKSYSVYAQARYKPTKRFNLLLGTQYNKRSGFDDDLVPRLGMVFHIHDRLGWNVLYGEAFRAPLGIELEINTPGVQQGNPDLKSETVANIDTQLFYHGLEGHLALTLFRAKQRDLISIAPMDLVIGLYVNQGELVYQGAELEVRYQPSPKWQFNGSVAYQQHENEFAQEDITRMPNTEVKWSLGYYTHKSSFGLGYIWRDKHPGTDVGDAPVSVFPEAGDYQLVSLNLGRRIDFSNKLQMKLELRGDNLLDEDIRTSDFLYNTYNSLPGYAPRSFYGSVKFQF